MAFGGMFPDSANGALGMWSFWAGVSIGVAVSRGFWADLETKLDSSKSILQRLGGN